MPLPTFPTSINPAQIELIAENVDALTASSFMYGTSVFKHRGERWRMSVNLPPCGKALARPWIGFLVGLRGRAGTFLAGDVSRKTPRGTATSLVVTGLAGAQSLTVVMTGSLLAGDYIQIGTDADATLHKVLQDQTGDGTLHIWPALRKDRTSVSATTTNTVGVFRLDSNITMYQINNMSDYGISFGCVEVT